MVNQKESQTLPFFVIEGQNGVGKSTQIARLQERLEAGGQPVARVKFPRYDSPGGHLAKRYLAGGYGSLEQIGPKLASVLFAVDRFDFKADLEAEAATGRLVLADRYVASNLAYQGAKIADASQRREFFNWEIDFEYGLLGVPRPLLNLILLVDPDTSRGLRAERQQASVSDGDIHAGDDFQVRTSRVYGELCQLYPQEFVGIDCQGEGGLKTEEEIGRLIYAAVEPHLNNQSS